jgi:outer membrane receptor for ferrienterochelin and colicins
MKKLIVLLTALLYTAIAYSQNTFKAIIKDAKTNLPLIGATALLQGSNKGASSDTAGWLLITNIPNGKQVIVFRYVGYQTLTDTLDFPLVQQNHC